MLLTVFSLLCVMLIGFATHRASLCNVRAVAEIMRCRSGFLLWSMARAMLWMAALTGVLAWLFAAPTAPVPTQESLRWAIVGGLLFGVGRPSMAAARFRPFIAWWRATWACS